MMSHVVSFIWFGSSLDLVDATLIIHSVLTCSLEIITHAKKNTNFSVLYHFISHLPNKRRNS